jgi:alpha-1,3-rhamnosyl/mannosyltransferase
MNVVFDARVVQDHFPGIGRYAYNLLAELPDLLREGEALTVLHDPSAKNTRYDLATLRERRDKRVMWVEYRQPIFDMLNVLRAPKILRGQTAVMHYPYYLRPRASKPPSVTTIYDAISFVYPQYAPSASAQLSIRLLHQMTMAASRQVITISQSAARDLARFFPSARGKLVVTPLAPDPVFRPQPPEQIERVRATFKLPQHFVLYLASNKPHKNLVGLV